MSIEELEKDGYLFEGWHVTKFLGEGSYGKVYEIEREEFGVKSQSALKVISIPKNRNEIRELMSEGMDEESASTYFRGFVEDFVRECQIMSNLKGNSNIVSFEDYKVVEHKNEIGWDILIRMEMLTPFVEYLNKHEIGRDEVLDLGIAVCKALELCKKQNIIHRDIKPANIFISQSGEYKLGDFGIARIISKSNGASTKVGTSDYMAPEVFKGELYDSSVDIYSLGIVLYRLLNRNRLPFLPPAPEPITHTQREDAVAKRMSGVELPIPHDADEAIFAVISKAMAYDPANRYKDPNEMRKALENIRFGTPNEPVVEKPVDNNANVETPVITETNEFDFDDEATMPAESIRNSRALSQDETGDKNKDVKDQQKKSKDSKSGSLGVDLAIGCAATVLMCIVYSPYSFWAFAIYALVYNILLFVLCMISYKKAKKGSKKPWRCYIVGGVLYGILLLYIVTHLIQFFLIAGVSNAALMITFGINIKKQLSEGDINKGASA